MHITSNDDGVGDPVLRTAVIPHRDQERNDCETRCQHVERNQARLWTIFDQRRRVSQVGVLIADAV